MRLHIFSGHVYVFHGLVVHVPLAHFFSLECWCFLIDTSSFNGNLIFFPIFVAILSVFNFNLALKILKLHFYVVKSLVYFFCADYSQSFSTENEYSLKFLKRLFFTVHSLTHLKLVVVYHALVHFLRRNGSCVWAWCLFSYCPLGLVW